MASKKAFDAMISEDWSNAKEIIATTSWTSADLEEQHAWQGYGCTLLIIAARSGKEDDVQLLLDAGAAIEAKDMLGDYTALHWAADRGHLKAVEILLDRGADIEAKDKNGSTPLIAASQNGQSEVVALLVERGANIHARSNNRYGRISALYIAAQRGHLKAAEILLDRGAEVEAMDTDGFTPLLAVARCGRSEVVTLLIDRGANINARNKVRVTALHLAVEYGHLKAAEILLDRGADTEVRNMYGLTPLMTAAYYGHSAKVALLVDRGANINAQDNDGWTPLILAARRSHSEVVALLIERGANINAYDNVCALMWAAFWGNMAVVKLLCRKGAADLRTKEKEGLDAWMNRNLENKEFKGQIIAAIREEAEWCRVKNFIVLLHIGGLSAADWSVRRIGGGGSMPATDGTAAAHSSSKVTLSGIKRNRVLENRDLCRIVVSYIIPKPL